MNKIMAGLALVAVLGLMAAGAAPLRADPLPSLWRVNVPYFDSHGKLPQTAIFWFGKVTPDVSYTDVRMGYFPDNLVVHVAMFDRRLWYNDYAPQHSQWPQGLTDYDSVTLYLNKTGPTGTSLENAYRFDGQLNAAGDPRAEWQAAYTWDGYKWTTATTTFTTEVSSWWETGSDGGLNNNENNRGWFLRFTIPWETVGLSGPPPAGTVWGLAMVVHDRDVEPTGGMQPDEVWPPEGTDLSKPSTWGQLHWGLPVYPPQSAPLAGTATIRNGLNGAVVREAAVGGGSVCGDPLDLNTYWTVWGTRSITSTEYFNVQNQELIADWPCFSKYFTTFPLDAIPSGKVVISATLSMYQFGNAGEGWTDPPPTRSYIQVLTVGPLGQDGQPWTPSTLTWNNAPLARENVAITPVDPIDGGPHVWRTWDVSRAVAEAYGAGQPLRLAVYSADAALHSGRYFRPSAYPDELYRPTLTVKWGESLRKTVRPPAAEHGQPLTFTLSFVGSGSALTMTDSLPAEVGAPGMIQVDGGGTAVYSLGSHRVTFTRTLTTSQAVTVTFQVNPIVSGPRLIRNTAVLTDALGHVSTDTAIAIVDPIRVWLSLIRR